MAVVRGWRLLSVHALSTSKGTGPSGAVLGFSESSELVDTRCLVGPHVYAHEAGAYPMPATQNPRTMPFFSSGARLSLCGCCWLLGSLLFSMSLMTWTVARVATVRMLVADFHHRFLCHLGRAANGHRGRHQEGLQEAGTAISTQLWRYS